MIPALFPTGTDRTPVADTRATPAIWSKSAEFDAIVARLVAETSKFTDLAASGSATRRPPKPPHLIEACFSCHGGPPSVAANSVSKPLSATSAQSHPIQACSDVRARARTPVRVRLYKATPAYPAP